MDNKDDDLKHLFSYDTDVKSRKKAEKGSLFDMNAGKEFIGVGDKAANERKGGAATVLYVVGGFAAIVIGLGICISMHKFLLGLIVLGAGAFLLYAIYDKIKTKCPECKRLGAMEITYSEDLAVGTDTTRYNVYQGAKHTHDEVDVKIYTTSKDYEQCTFCGHCRDIIRTRKTDSFTSKKY